MKTSLAYIDDVMDRTIEAEVSVPSIPQKDRAEAKAKANKSIAGFHLHDEAAERKMLDEKIEKRRQVLETFRTEREMIRIKLGDVGVIPLAVLPSSAWLEICKRAGLIRLVTDKWGKVRIARSVFHEFQGVKGKLLGNITPEQQIEHYAKHNWAELMGKFFPNGEQPSGDGPVITWNHATLVMPVPPDDVAQVLLKAQNFPLQVATVADAIGFKESMGQLLKAEQAKIEEEIRYREWLRNDPIVYTEEGSATAIIAQFGDFPIEKDVVDFVVASDHLIVERPKSLETSPVVYANDSDMMRQMAQMQFMAEQARRQGMAGLQVFGGIGSSQNAVTRSVLDQMNSQQQLSPYNPYRS